MPEEPVRLTVEQIEALNKKLSALRHDINNHMALILAAAELIRHKPEAAARLLGALTEQPARISDALAGFSQDFEAAFGIKRL